MLYCQKCHHEYNETGQRFCINDGSRLIPSRASQKGGNQAGGVFTALLGNVISGGEDRKIAAPTIGFSKTQIKTYDFPQHAEPDFLEIGADNIEKQATQSPKNKPLPRIINQSEIPSGQAELGDRETHPAGRDALTREKPEILLGQTVKGRYQVIEKFSENESSITYLAKDRLAADKKVFICVLMEESGDYEANRDFAEEAVSLSHVNHPNINRVIDSGSLLEGKFFIVSEFIEGTSLKEILAQNREFEILRAARIIKQAGDALSVAHQNGIPHRNLSPENIILSINEAGTEQVKITNFGISRVSGRSESFSYKSPEQLEGKPVNYASDIYSLAIIAYLMLTGRLPFNASTAGEHTRLRREGMTLRPSNFRLDVPFEADDILNKALAYKPSERYRKARDFGDSLYNVLAAIALPEENIAKKQNAEIFTFEDKSVLDEQDDLLSIAESDESKAEPPVVTDNILIDSTHSRADVFDKAQFFQKEETPIKEQKTTEKSARQKRSIEPEKTGNLNLIFVVVLGIILLFAGLWGIWAYFFNRPVEPQIAPVQSVRQDQTEAVAETPQTASIEPQNPMFKEESEVPPPPRNIETPPNSVRFENSKENLSKELLKDYLGFSLYYPNNWKKNKAENKFIDISIDAPNGMPIEQMMISPYESKGTFAKDKELFPNLVEKSNKDLAKALSGNYEVISEGETTVQNGRWKAYEVKFRGSGNVGGDKVTVWGRRLWIPAQSPGAKSGFIITMLATSYSNEVKSAEDVGVKGRLAEILYTFEPNTNLQ